MTTTPGTPARPCAQCGAPASLAPSNPWRPFCSERCKLLDLGAWVAGRYALPVADDEAEPESDPGPRPQ